MKKTIIDFDGNTKSFFAESVEKHNRRMMTEAVKRLRNKIINKRQFIDGGKSLGLDNFEILKWLKKAKLK